MRVGWPPLPLLVSVLVLGLVAEGPTTAAQPAARRPFRVGVLNPAFGTNPPSVQGIKAGLRAEGLEEDRDVVFETRVTAGNTQMLVEAARDLARARVDAIVASGEEAARAAARATRTVPIVFIDVGDPVAAGLVTAINRSGTNITGVSGLTTELAPKRLELLKTIAPTLNRVWAIHHVDDHGAAAAARRAQEAAPQLRLSVVVHRVRTAEELTTVLKAVPPGDGLFAPAEPLLDVPGQMLIASLWSRLPVIYVQGFWVRGVDPGRGLGGLVSYGADYEATGFQAARLVARILRGAKPQDLPVEGAMRIQLVVNLNTAKAFRFTVPSEVLNRADEVVQEPIGSPR